MALEMLGTLEMNNGVRDVRDAREMALEMLETLEMSETLEMNNGVRDVRDGGNE